MRKPIYEALIAQNDEFPETFYDDRFVMLLLYDLVPRPQLKNFDIPDSIVHFIKGRRGGKGLIDTLFCFYIIDNKIHSHKLLKMHYFVTFQNAFELE